jgi:hypothetical protein
MRTTPPFDLKKGRVAPDDTCPTDCPNTLTFFGKCFEESFPGNVAFGLILGLLGYHRYLLIGASDFVNHFEKEGGSDPYEDAVAVYIGAIAAIRIRKYIENLANKYGHDFDFDAEFNAVGTVKPTGDLSWFPKDGMIPFDGVIYPPRYTENGNYELSRTTLNKDLLIHLISQMLGDVLIPEYYNRYVDAADATAYKSAQEKGVYPRSLYTCFPCK